MLGIVHLTAQRFVGPRNGAGEGCPTLSTTLGYGEVPAGPVGAVSAGRVAVRADEDLEGPRGTPQSGPEWWFPASDRRAPERRRAPAGSRTPASCSGAQLQERPRFLAGRAAAPGNAQEKALSGPNPARRSYTARYHHGLTRLSAFDLTADRQQRKAQQHRPDEAQDHLDQPSCVGQRLLGGKERGR